MDYKSRFCNFCCKRYATRQSFWNHKQKCGQKNKLIVSIGYNQPNHQLHCVDTRKDEDIESESSSKQLRNPRATHFGGNRKQKEEIPTFDGAEFCGEKPVSRETLDKMMKMLNIPEERRERIAREEEKYQKEKFITESSGEPSNELELEETIEDFQQYYSDLIKNKNRENVPEMIDILNIWKGVGEISEHRYKEVLRKIKSV